MEISAVGSEIADEHFLGAVGALDDICAWDMGTDLAALLSSSTRYVMLYI